MSMLDETRYFPVNLLFLLEETFESPPKASTAYLDKRSGWFVTLDGISAEEASRPVAPGGSTIAAQVEHTRYYLEVLQAFLQGRSKEMDWPGSWKLQQVDEAGWAALKQALKEEYERLKTAIETTPTWGDDQTGEGMAILAHSAYHLGAVRQMIRVVR